MVEDLLRNDIAGVAAIAQRAGHLNVLDDEIRLGGEFVDGRAADHDARDDASMDDQLARRLGRADERPE